MTDQIKHRETWLNQMAALMTPRFEQLGYKLPSFRVSIGFPSAGKNGKAAAEAWSVSASGDGHHEIFIRPDFADSMLVAGHLAHELIHTAVGFDQGHSGNFAKVALSIGLKRPMTATVPGPTFEYWVTPFIEQLGPIPHAQLTWRTAGVVVGGVRVRALRKAADGADDEPGIYTSAPPKQTTRLIKAACSECGYTVRLTQKWLEVGPPHCPEHGAMQAE